MGTRGARARRALTADGGATWLCGTSVGLACEAGGVEGGGGERTRAEVVKQFPLDLLRSPRSCSSGALLLKDLCLSARFSEEGQSSFGSGTTSHSKQETTSFGRHCLIRRRGTSLLPSLTSTLIRSRC